MRAIQLSHPVLRQLKFALIPAVLLLAGCATSEEVAALRADVAKALSASQAAEQRAGNAAGSANQAATDAKRAADAAEQAAKAANNAADKAGMAAEKSDRVFRQSLKK